MTERVGFIGFGIMGRPMAKNLLRAGYPLIVWNRSRPGIEALAAEGAGEGTSAADVAARSDVVITMVGYTHDVEEVVLGPNGIVEGAYQGLTHIDMSTISPDATRRIAARLLEAGVEMLDAPVTGGEQGAIDGTLSIMVGGKEETLARCRPLLEVMGRKVTYCGPSGNGQIVKLCNQVVVGLNNLAVCEALVLAAKASVAPRIMLEAITGGAATSWALQNLAPRMLERDFRPGFKVAHQQKDLRLALELAGSLSAALPGTSLVHQLFAAVEAQGLENEGTQALVKALERLANAEVKGD